MLGELCGADEPFRLVGLAPDERVFGIERIADRYYYVVFREQTTGSTTRWLDPALWSVGSCGESPRRIAEGVSKTFTDPRWPGVLLGCRGEERDIVSVDLAGVEPPHVVFADIDCLARPTRHGLLSLDGADEEPAALVLHPYPDDPRTETSEPRVLLSPTISPQYPIVGDLDARLSVHGDTASVLTTDGTIVTVGLADGALTVEQTNVRNYYMSPDGRYILYQDLGVTGGGGQHFIEGTVFLRDRTTGVGASLAQDWLNYEGYSLDFTDAGIVTLTLDRDNVRVYFLPGLDFVDLPEDLVLVRQIPDGRWLIQAWWGGGPIYLADLHDLDSATMLFGEGAIVPTASSVDGITVVAAGGCCNPYDYRDEGAVWFVPFDGSAPRRLVDRASGSIVEMDERRMATALNIDNDELADLVLLDRSTGAEQLVDRAVYRPYIPLKRAVDDIFYYSVIDGERSGVWIFRPPPTP